MQLRSFAFCLAVAFSSLAFAASAAKVANPQRGEMEEIFFLSGLEAQLEGFGAGLDASLADQADVFPADQLRVLRAAVADVFAADTLRQSVHAGLVTRYDARGAAGTLAWLRSPLGRRITQLEEAGSSAEALSQLEAFAAGIAAAPPAPERLALIARLHEATGVADVSVDLAMASTLGVALGANATQPAGQRADEAALRAAVAAQRPVLASQMLALMQLSSLQTYAPLGDADLGRYVEFAESGAGRWYHAAVVRELVAALRSAADGVGAAVAAELDAASPGPASAAR